jgi:Mrp family chromosome partitioning ATPase
MSIGFLLTDPDGAVIWRGPKKFTAILQFLADVAWGDLDYLVIDAPPGTGDEPLAACELTEEKLPRPPGRRPDRGAVIVTTPQSVAVTDVRRCIAFCREVGMPVHGVIENMSGLVCPACGHQIDVFLRGGGEEMAADMGVPFLGRIPLDPAVVESGERGMPIVLRSLWGDETEPAQPAVRAFCDIADRIQDRIRAPAQSA